MRHCCLRDVTKWIKGKIDWLDSRVITGVSVDTRKIVPGDLFFALSGAQADGHRFIEEAIAKGAQAIIAHKSYLKSFSNTPIFRVEDTLGALQSMAKSYLASWAPSVIAITGSIGKTTTKNFIYSLLKDLIPCAVNPNSYNSQIGLPLSIFQTTGKEKIVFLEMGMSEPGNIRKLIEIAPPDIAALIDISLSHAAFFEGQLTRIAEEKSDIFIHPQTQKGLIYLEIPFVEKIKRKALLDWRTFSLIDKTADYYLEKVDGVFIWQLPSRKKIELGPINLPKHHYSNLLAALSLCDFWGIDPGLIQEKLPFLQASSGRFHVVTKKGVTIINDTYNASVASMTGALENFPHEKGRKIAVLGEMKELGQLSASSHEAVGKSALKFCDVLFCLGEQTYPMYDLWQKEKRHVFFFKQKSFLIDTLLSFFKTGDQILVKGSRSLNMEDIVEALEKAL